MVNYANCVLLDTCNFSKVLADGLVVQAVNVSKRLHHRFDNLSVKRLGIYLEDSFNAGGLGNLRCSEKSFGFELAISQCFVVDRGQAPEFFNDCHCKVVYGDRITHIHYVCSTASSLAKCRKNKRRCFSNGHEEAAWPISSHDDLTVVAGLKSKRM